MTKKRSHIALILLASFLLGGFEAPLFHELYHVHELYVEPGKKGYNDLNVDAICDLDEYARESDRACVWCTFSLDGIPATLPFVDAQSVPIPYFIGSQFQVFVTLFIFSIRGPPVRINLL